MLFMASGIIIGAIITKYRIKSENQKLLDAITAQIAAFQTKASTAGRLSASEQTILTQEKAQADLLKQL